MGIEFLNPITSTELINKFKNIKELDDSNSISLYGKFLGVEEQGIYKNTEYFVVLMETYRNKQKPYYVWVLLDTNTIEAIKLHKDSRFYVEGNLNVSYTFNEKAITHTFVVPKEILKLEESTQPIEFPRNETFHENFTVGNRTIVEGKITDNIWKEGISGTDKEITKFQISTLIDNKVRKLYCSVFDNNPVKDLIKEGAYVTLVGSFTMLKKERGLLIENFEVVESKKNKLDSYVIIVQHIDILD